MGVVCQVSGRLSEVEGANHVARMRRPFTEQQKRR